jgi:hypothetical protein
MPATAAIVLVHGALADTSCGPQAPVLLPGEAQRWALSTAIHNASEGRERQPESGRLTAHGSPCRFSIEFIS